MQLKHPLTPCLWFDTKAKEAAALSPQKKESVTDALRQRIPWPFKAST